MSRLQVGKRPQTLGPGDATRPTVHGPLAYRAAAFPRFDLATRGHSETQSRARVTGDSKAEGGTAPATVHQRLAGRAL